MQRNHEQLRISTTRRAMTLVELLIVGAVIAILATLTLTAVSMVATTTKITKTRATIQKLDVAMQQIFESYEDTFIVLKNKVAKEHPDPDEGIQRRIAVHFLRDLMRMEMPQTWADVRKADGNPLEPLKLEMETEDDSWKRRSPLLDYYCEAYGKAKEKLEEQGKTEPPNRSALLFLIIQNLNPEALEAFHGSEIADTDGDGLLEFVDAWGKPIQFLRWAPAFTDSDLQPNVLALCDPKYNPKTDDANWWTVKDARLRRAMEQATEQQPFLLGLGEGEHDDFGWFLYPLIYSAGPDGEYGINEGSDTDTPVLNSDGKIDPYAFPYGMPDGSGKHFDNIHNHRWFRSF